MPELNNDEREELNKLRHLFKILKCHHYCLIALKVTHLWVAIDEMKTWYRQRRIDISRMEERSEST